MSPWQAAQQLKFKLATLMWPNTSSPVFAAVHATQGPLEGAVEVRRPPLAIVRALDATPDPISPGLKQHRWEVIVAVASAGDQLGEYALIGGQRSGSLGKGRGVLEVEEQVLGLLALGDQTLGFNIVEVNTAAAEAAEVPEVGYVVQRSYTFTSYLTTGRTYGAPNGTNVLGATVGTPSAGLTPVTLTWAVATQRFDHHPVYAVPVLVARGALVLVRKAGSSAPSNYLDGTTVASGFTSGFTDSLATGAGSFTYGLFAQFDEYGDGATSIQYSAPAVSATVAV